MREWLLVAASVTVSLILGLGIILWWAPALLGSSSVVRIVQSDDRVVPFYEGIFRPEDRGTDDIMLADPTMVVRSRPFLEDRGALGPTDALGFRNRSVPRSPRVITIGDSQTYGTGVPLESAWPHRLGEALGNPEGVYDMSTGGWGAAQYLQMWEAAAFFEPEVVVIAYYAGNDPREAFTAAYSIDHFRFLRPTEDLGADDLPAVEYPTPPSEIWNLQFQGGSILSLTPTLRLASNLEHPAIAAGWEIMARVAERILESADAEGPKPIFTLIPTKERVFEKRLRSGGIGAHEAYDALVAGEAAYTRALAQRIRNAGGHFVNVAGPLRQAALATLEIYPSTTDGHMAPAGHAIVAEQIRAEISALLD